MAIMKDGIRASMSEDVERQTIKGLFTADWCDICHAPQMVTPDGAHHCGELCQWRSPGGGRCLEPAEAPSHKDSTLSSFHKFTTSKQTGD